MSLRKSLILLSFLMSILFLFACGQVNNNNENSDSDDSVAPDSGSVEAADDVIEWDLSLYGGPREWTIPVEKWAEDMFEQTEGRWKITIHYGEALSDSSDNLQGLTNGLFEAAAVVPFYTPGVIPLNQVMDLPLISPIAHEELSLFQKAAWEHPAILEELAEHNTVPLLHSVPSQYDYSGKTKLESVEDLKGMRVAGMSAEQGKVLEKFGAVPNPMPAPELFSALDRGTIDGVIFPYTYGHIANSFHEVSKHTTNNLALGSPGSFYLANKDAWEALPEDIQEIHDQYIENWHEISAQPYYDADEKYIPLLKEELEYTEFPEEEREKLIDASQEIWDEWVEKYKDRGPTQEILDYMLEKRMEISGF